MMPNETKLDEDPAPPQLTELEGVVLYFLGGFPVMATAEAVAERIWSLSGPCPGRDREKLVRGAMKALKRIGYVERAPGVRKRWSLTDKGRGFLASYSVVDALFGPGWPKHS